MIGVEELRKGVTFTLDGQLFQVLEYTHNKQGRGNATIRLRLRNLLTGANIDKSFQSGSRVEDIRLDHRVVQYLYHDGNLYHFMDTETYEQTALSADKLGDDVHFLKDGSQLKLSTYDGKPVNVELPVTVELKIVESLPGVKGDTATGATKPATLETGYTLQVPLFVNQGDTVRVDTRTGEYLTRV